MDSKMNTLRENNFLPPHWKNGDTVFRGRESSNPCTLVLLQEIKSSGSCVIMKWHFLEQLLTNSDSIGMQTTKLAQTGIKGLCWSAPDYKLCGRCGTHILVRCLAFISQLWTLGELPGWCEYSHQVPCPAMSLRNQMQAVAGSACSVPVFGRGHTFSHK